jgi:hypothetical protein
LEVRNRLDKFVGHYLGNTDGRRAALAIVKIGDTPYRLRITLDDLERDAAFVGVYVPTMMNEAAAHVLRDIVLKQTDSDGQVVIPMLLLHTWNNDLVSGTTLWNGQLYGANFERSAIRHTRPTR